MVMALQVEQAETRPQTQGAKNSRTPQATKTSPVRSAPNPLHEAAFKAVVPCTKGSAATGVQQISGWYYCWNRMYDPLIGRFTSPDPAATPWMNLSDYVASGPTNRTDSSGLATVSGHVMSVTWIPDGSLPWYVPPWWEDNEPASTNKDTNASWARDLTESNDARFMSYLHAYIETGNANNITAAHFHGDSGSTHASVWFANLGVKTYDDIKEHKKITDPKRGCECEAFRQVVGGRSTRPAGIGAVVGWGVGLRFGVPGVNFVGAAIGAFVADWIANAPPIWTVLELILCADGTQTSSLSDYSWFPKHRKYAPNDGPANDSRFDYSAQYTTGHDLAKWQDNGWGKWDGGVWLDTSLKGNPWDIDR